MHTKWTAICRYCGRKGSMYSISSERGMPTFTPAVPGKCSAHPSGKPNMPHSPQWVRM